MERGGGADPRKNEITPAKDFLKKLLAFSDSVDFDKRTGSPEIFLAEFHESNGTFIHRASVFPSSTRDAPRIELHKTRAVRSVIHPLCAGKTSGRI